MGRYFDELKRRKVFRVAAAYAVVCWLAIEVVDTLAPRMGMPDWVPGLVILLVVIGFPIALVISWAFEMTPEGIRRTTDTDPEHPVTSTTGQKINYVIIAALAGVILFQQIAPRMTRISPFSESTPESATAAIAVLPFADLSVAGDQEYLGDGVAEEILNVLAKVQGLKVTSRTSAFAFKEQNLSLPEIGKILGVNHVVEGSIRKQNNRVRITAQLIDVNDDSHLWSETYDSDLGDIFQLQDEIAKQISMALSTELDLALPTQVHETPDWNIGAYELFLRARQLVSNRTDLDEAIELADAATALEPEFADAWAEMAAALTIEAYALRLDAETINLAPEFLDRAKMAARRTLEIDSLHPYGLAVQGLIWLQQKRWIEARIYFDRALSVEYPNQNAYVWLGILQLQTGETKGSLATFERGLEMSPTDLNLLRWRDLQWASAGEWQQIWKVSERGVAGNRVEMSFEQQFAALHLGIINIDDFLAWMEERDSSATPEERALQIQAVETAFSEDSSHAWEGDFETYAGDLARILTVLPELSGAYWTAHWAENAEGPLRNLLQFLWLPAAADFRGSPFFVQLVTALNLPAYWDLFGWPDVCHPTTLHEFECE